MKKSKVIWSLVLLLSVISCSIEDLQTEQLQENEGLSLKKIGLSLDDYIYGMPVADFEVPEESLIKVTYNTDDPGVIFSVRQEFSAKYATLYLVKPITSNSAEEHWVLKPGQNSGGGTIDHPDDDKDIDVKDLYTVLLTDIRAHELVNISGEVYPPLEIDTNPNSTRN